MHHRNKPHGRHRPAVNLPGDGFVDDDQFLRVHSPTDRGDQPAAPGELVEECSGNVRRGRRQEYAVEGRFAGPTLVSVPCRAVMLP